MLPVSPNGVDLEALAEQLIAAGFEVEITRGAIGTRALNCCDWIVRDWTACVSAPANLTPIGWAVGDIIRKHVEGETRS